MKVLGICGSPRKGNSYRALQAIREDYPEVDFKILHLNVMDFQQCRGCYSCILNGEDNCPLKDDREKIISEIMESDGVVFTSPVYCMQVSSVMKNFIDRLGYNAHRPLFFEKFAMTAVTCSGYGGKEVNNYMKGIFSSFGFSLVSSVELKVRPGGMKEEDRLANLERTRAAFDTLLERIRNGKRTPPTIGLLVPFYLFREVSRLKKDVMTADYEYYRDRGDYSYELRIPLIKKKIAEGIVRKILRAGCRSGRL